MGKGSPPAPKAPEQQTITQTDLPAYVQPQFERLLARAEAESERPYELFGGRRRTGLTAGQQEAVGLAENVARSGVGSQEQDLASRGLTGAAAYDPGSVGFGYNPERALLGTQYVPGQIASSYAAGAAPDPYQAGTIVSGYDPRASDFQSRTFTDPGVVDEYINPFIENVVDRQSAKMRRDFQETRVPQLASEAVGAGAFGGSRQRIQEQQARGQLEDRIADFQAQQRLQGYQQAQQAFQQDRARNLQVQQMRDQAARAAGQLGVSAQELQERARAQAGQLGIAGYQAAERARAQEAQLGLTGQTAQDQAQQQRARQALAAQDAVRQGFGQQADVGLRSGQLGLQGAQQRAAAAAQLGQQADRRQAFEARRADILRQASGIRQQDEQQALDLAYSDFLNQRDFPRQQLGFMSGILRGVPVSPTMETTQYTAQPSNAQQMMGFGLGGLGLLRGLR